MKRKDLGKTNLNIAPISLGCNVFGWTINEESSFNILDSFTGSGYNLLDTADSYSRWVPGNKGGESETIIGNWMQQKKNRHDVIITTKVGSDMGDGRKGLSMKYILQEAEDSLRRLKTDYIDLYLTHFDDAVTPVDETLEAYAKLVASGKVRWIGTSNMTVERIKESLEASNKYGYPSYQVLEPEFNLYQRENYENNYEQLCIDNNIGVICYFSLASGFLTGKYRSEQDFSKSSRGAGMGKYLDERGLSILKALDIVSGKLGVSQATVAIAWLIARPSISAPIASATTEAQLKEILAAADIQLDMEDILLLNGASEWK